MKSGHQTYVITILAVFGLTALVAVILGRADEAVKQIPGMVIGGLMTHLTHHIQKKAEEAKEETDNP